MEDVLAVSKLIAVVAEELGPYYAEYEWLDFGWMHTRRKLTSVVELQTS